MSVMSILHTTLTPRCFPREDEFPGLNRSHEVIDT